MYKSKAISITMTEDISKSINSMAYAASKLWNVGNYEKKNYKTLEGFDNFPNWYNQKKRLKTNHWFKCLPSQSAQDILQQLQEGWVSFFQLIKNQSIENPKPPKYKQEPIAFTYLKDGFKFIDGKLRLTITKTQKEYLSTIGINNKFLYLEIDKHFPKTDSIKEIRIYPGKNNCHKVIFTYEIEDMSLKPDNGRYLSIDLGVNNLMTCYDNIGKTFIVGGNDFIKHTHYFYKQISHYQSINSSQQYKKGIKYPKPSKRVKRLYNKKNNIVKNLLHQTTTYVVNYCKKNNINMLIVGDIKGIRKDKNLGVANQKFHSFPYEKIYALLEYKCAQAGINFAKQNEAYSSKSNPEEKYVGEKYVTGTRSHRGLYKTKRAVYNADSVGAYNILRLYKQKSEADFSAPLVGLSNPIKIYPCN